MIESLHLQNFQGHKDSLFEFVPGINAITGKSDNGKSSIVRALHYARYNRPASNNYPSHWIKNDKSNLTGEMSVGIKKDSDTVIRYRTKDENGYKINGETLKAINRDVPEQVASILNLSEVNIQKQLDSHFLLSDTNGQTAQFFNSLVKMDEIDDYLTEAERLKRKNNKDIKELTEKLGEQETELKRYSWIEKAEKLNKSLALVEADLYDLSDNRQDLVIIFLEHRRIINELLEPQGLDRKPKLFINKNLKEFITQMQLITYRNGVGQQTNTGDPFTKPKDHHFDLIHAMRYAIVTYYRQKLAAVAILI